MKRTILFFTVCLGLSVSQTAFSDTDTARAATRRTQSTQTAITTGTAQRVAQTNTRKSEQQNKNTRTATAPTPQRVVSRSTTATQPEKTRTTTTRPQTTPGRTATSRATQTRTGTTNTVKTTARSGIRPNTNVSRSRAAELNATKISDIKSKNYSNCKTVYFECMDEFCANKDANLRRCACSSRIHEFDAIKKQLSSAEDKMLDFNQRLLTVGLDAADAAAINVASDGETAFNTKDKTESEKLLKTITDTLNNSGDSRLNNNLSAISLSLDMDAAWDGVDSLGGVATTSKSGLDLYNAARPICIEMANEVCDADELNIAQTSYQLTIQQDCETVAKSYKTLYTQAQEKIHESGALLDMSRLSIYQQRNSDDILTCKKKILTQLTDSAVCGENLYKCLDTTGQYINPSNGTAFLSTNLYNLTKLLQEPIADEKWSQITQNESFVNFLNSKRTFLEPAIAQCRDIADTVWNDFLDDALAQIKLAQNAKMEEIRQNCTTLIAQCRSDAITDLSEFDARALSTFSVLADATATSMCANVMESCVALMNNIDESQSWQSGILGISADITYDAIIDTCTQIGRDCIIQQCNGTSGNFALCQNVVNDKRSAILMREACWNTVKDCVANAANIDNITTDIISNRQSYYASLYSGVAYNSIPTFCDADDRVCLLSEQIWGNCEYEPNAFDIIDDRHNKILIPNRGSTLLSWFAQNTGTTSDRDSCNANKCPINFTNLNGKCESTALAQARKTINVTSNLTNPCDGGILDTFGNCCANNSTSGGICVPNGEYYATMLQTITCDGAVHTSGDDYYLCPDKSTRKISIYCISSNSTNAIELSETDDGTQYYCNGIWILIDQYGNYFDIPGNSGAPTMSYTSATNDNCTYRESNGWGWPDSCGEITSSVPTNNEFTIQY